MQEFVASRAEAAALFDQRFDPDDIELWLPKIIDGEQFGVSDGRPITVEMVPAGLRPRFARRLVEVNRLSMYRRIVELDGERDFTKLTGANGPPLDKIEFTRAQYDHCGCSVLYTWHSDSAENHRQHRGHRIERCAAHADGPADPHDCFEAIVEEQRRKNFGLAAAAQLAGIAPEEIAWRFDDRRQLIFKHPALPRILSRHFEQNGRTILIEG